MKRLCHLDLLTLRSESGFIRVSFHADKTAKIWNATSGKELIALCGHAGDVSHLCISPDGKWLATAHADKTAKIWNTEGGLQDI